MRLRDELMSHRDRLVDDYVAQGMDRRAAERRVFLEFGNVAALEDSSRDVRGRILDDFRRDGVFALRTLRRNPGFAAAAVLSLALAIGVNTAVFSLVNAVLVRPLPVGAPDELVQITRLTPDGRPASVSYPLFEHLRDNVRSISGAFAHGTSSETIAIDGEPDFVAADLVSGAYFDVLRVQPGAGRLLRPDDDQLTATPVAIISDSYWTRQFGRAPSALGTTFTMRGRVFTIVGVTPAAFQSVRIGTSPDVIVPLVLALSDEQRREPTSNVLRLVARLKPGGSVEQTSAEAQQLWQAFITSLTARVPGGLGDEVQNRRVAALPASGGLNAFRDELSEPLWIVMGIVVSILVLASVNLCGLLTARATAREREIAIRLAIGAGRTRLVRQFLTESAVLATFGAVVGLAMATWLSAALVNLFINGRELELSVAPDWRVGLFTVVIALGVSGIGGLVPAVQALRARLNPSLKQVRAHGHGHIARLLVSAQVAISMALLVVAALFVGSLVNLYRADRGFDAEDVLVVNVRTTEPIPAERAMAVSTALLERLKATPGVRSASAAEVIPVAGNSWSRGIDLPDGALRAGEASTAFNAVAPGYFATLRTSLLSGRDFRAGDISSSAPVSIVNDSFARHFFGGEPPIGRRVSSLGIAYEIVGVVGDAVHADLRQGVERTMYIPWTQRGDATPSNFRYLLRVAGEDPMLRATVERVVRDLDPALRAREILPYSTIIDRSMPGERILATLGGVFGVLAVTLAGIGMFALLAFQVARRTNELGVRMVLGSTRASLVGLVLRDVVRMLVPGVILGGVAARSVADFARGLLFGLTPADARIYIVAAGILVSAAIAAAWVPAQRAARVDPLTALRQD
jgi:predicted permease